MPEKRNPNSQKAAGSFLSSSLSSLPAMVVSFLCAAKDFFPVLWVIAKPLGHHQLLGGRVVALPWCNPLVAGNVYAMLNQPRI
ncbi:hypothetical protein KA005_11090 [bacterium]|nr:hypothetical protein [bacterium]